MRFLVLWLALLTGLVAAEPARMRVLLLTPGLQADTLEAKTFRQVLEQRVETKAPQINLVMPHGEDPRLTGLPADRTPTGPESLAAAERFAADYVVTLNVRFEHRVERGILTVVGVALVTVDSKAEKRRTFSDPVVFHSDQARSDVDRQAQELTVESAQDLANAIVDKTRLK